MTVVGKVLVLAAVAAVMLLALVATGVIPLGWFDGDASRRNAYESELDLEDGDAVGLEGRGTAEADPAAGRDGALVSEPEVPAEVRGGTRNGASVRGRVVFARSGAPAAGVAVRLFRKDSFFHYLRAEPRGRFDTLDAKTGPDGRFAFVDVTPAARYVVRARLDPHARVSTDRLDLRGREQLDLGDLTLGPAAVVTGRVLDGEGKPAKDVRVAATWRIENDLNVVLADPDTFPEIEVETTTDESGAYRLEGLEPGEKTVAFKAPTGATAVFGMTAPAGEETSAGDTMLAGDHVIAGSVTWSDGSPIAGARVFAGPAINVLRTVETGADGRFRLRWLPPAEHSVGVVVEGLPVDLGQAATGTEDYAVVFPVPGRLAGRVVREGSGEPVTRFRVEVQRTDILDGRQRFVQAIMLRTLGPTPFESEDGSFVFDRLSPGTYQVAVEAAGFPKTSRSNVVVVGGETTEGLVIEMPRGNVARGKVLRADGSALGSARLYVLAQDVAARGPDLEAQVESLDPATTTGPDGRFELPAHAPATIHVAIAHDAALATLHAVDLESGDVSGLEFVMPAAGAVEGRLLDPSGRPADTDERFYVLYPDGTYYNEPIGEDGRFRLTGLPVGACVVRPVTTRDTRRYLKVIQADDADAKRAAYDELRLDGGERFVTDGQTLRLTLELPRRVRFSGSLIVAGERDSGVGLWIVLPEGGWGTWVEVDEFGRFEAGIEPGAYVVWSPDAEGVWKSEEITVPDQREFARDIER